MTRKQLERFVNIRNKSGFASNLQFQIDANKCGFKISDLGEVIKYDWGYEWQTPHGKLQEVSGCLMLKPTDDELKVT